ncbi:MAG: polyprenyl synthetase family protein [Acidilobaceae archaeon]|nr:polyprenyl synthetase family protein [Acidilobaceae archaeon]MCX8165816.1 polyprenyl synthetase family protein [Acidilobaceae archaeon]MDW7974240.1 polyprenyl synthetase family protein [Sulfolobales archaeon]
MENIEFTLFKYARVVDHYIYERLTGTPEELYRAALHLIKAGGKRLRPTIALLTAKMLGGIEAESRAIPLAAAIEISHNFTLVHDDIMDKDEYRRGVPTVHKVWGEPWAILAGDLLHAFAYRFIVFSTDHGMSKGDAHEAMKVLTVAGIKVSRGQAYDLMFENRWDVTPVDYLDMVYHKTGAMMEASAKLGAIAARASNEVIELMGQFGSLLGVAFQVRDDYLGVFGDPKKTGKPIYNDIRRGKKTLLVLLTMSMASEKEKELLMRVLDPNVQKKEEEVLKVVDLMKLYGADVEAMKIASAYAERAKEILREIRDIVDPAARDVLMLMADYSVTREK